jgi:hypothetical protein
MSISVIFSRYFDFLCTQLWGPAIWAKGIFINSRYAQKFSLNESFLKTLKLKRLSLSAAPKLRFLGECQLVQS